MKKVIGLVAVSLFASCLCFAQSAWQMQPIQIQTRWAKQVSPVNALPEYPRPQMVRKQWQNLNGLWSYAITKETKEVPRYVGKILVPYPIESALSGVKKALQPSEFLWYKRSITKPTLKNGERTLLHFGAVDFEATVYVNGKEVGKHTGGYQNFSFDITDNLKTGNNELVVKVWDPSDAGPNPHGKQVLNPGGIMYTPSSGIWQTVWLETVPAVSISSLRITPDVDNKKLYLEVKVTGNADNYNIEAIAKNKTAIQATTKGKINSVISIPVSNARLWSPDDPFLYDLDIRLLKNGKPVDAVQSYFGMRKIEVKKDSKGIERIFLNGKYTYNLGTLDQGFWPDGLYTAPTDAALKFDIEASKAMGFNTIRKHIKIEPARWYYYCDQLGMLVWQDMVNPGSSTTQFEKECAENLEQLHNYPSITTWVLFNENWGAYDQGRLTQWMKNTDPSRIVNGHSGSTIISGKMIDPKPVFAKSVNSDMTDIHSYPPPGFPPHMDGKAMVVGEFGGIGVSIEGHVWDDFAAGWGYGNSVNPKTMILQFTDMVDSLKAMETRGLSGSIYTQPFDVETEQNGLMTYDREFLKMPLATLKQIHSRLWPITANSQLVTTHFNAKIAAQESDDYFARLEKYKKGNRESNFLYYLAIMANGNKDKASAAKVSDDYIKQLKTPFTFTNLKFISKFTPSVHSRGFELFYNNVAKVDQIIGKDEAEAVITAAIEADEIIPHLYDGKGSQTDWPALEKRVAKYGELGKETLAQYRVITAFNNSDEAYLKEAAIPWLNKYGRNRKWVSDGMLNIWGWKTFENSTDTAMLKIALELSACSLTKGSDPNNIDTYANLLYKLGRKDEAIQWEKKALERDPNRQEFKETVDRMQSGR